MRTEAYVPVYIPKNAPVTHAEVVGSDHMPGRPMAKTPAVGSTTGAGTELSSDDKSALCAASRPGVGTSAEPIRRAVACHAMGGLWLPDDQVSVGAERTGCHDGHV